MKTVLTAAALALFACTTPAPEPPGIEEQPKGYHYERNPAEWPTTSDPGSAERQDDPMMPQPNTEPQQNPMGEGHTRTPGYVDAVEQR